MKIAALLGEAMLMAGCVEVLSMSPWPRSCGTRARGCFPVPNYLHSDDVTAVKELTQIYWVSYLGKVKLGRVNRNEFEVCERDEDNTRSRKLGVISYTIVPHLIARYARNCP